MMASPFNRWSLLIEEALEQYLPAESTPPAPLHQAMRYTTLGGGKRLRGVLVLAAAQGVGGEITRVLPAAAAVEMVHAYSLIHDDLPCMDDDELRRGKPANHIVYGEAVALLAGDALLTEAFALLAITTSHGATDSQALKALRALAWAAGSRGMVGGQAEDLANTGAVDLATLDFINDGKTGALIRSALAMGATLSGAKDGELQALDLYGAKIGRAFQIIDDLLDEVGSVEVTGKPSGSDRALGKLTYPGILGLEGARHAARKLIAEAKETLTELTGETGPLEEIADFVLSRDR